MQEQLPVSVKQTGRIIKAASSNPSVCIVCNIQASFNTRSTCLWQLIHKYGACWVRPKFLIQTKFSQALSSAMCVPCSHQLCLDSILNGHTVQHDGPCKAPSPAAACRVVLLFNRKVFASSWKLILFLFMGYLLAVNLFLLRRLFFGCLLHIRLF